MVSGVSSLQGHHYAVPELQGLSNPGSLFSQPLVFFGGEKYPVNQKQNCQSVIISDWVLARDLIPTLNLRGERVLLSKPTFPKRAKRTRQDYRASKLSPSLERFMRS